MRPTRKRKGEAGFEKTFGTRTVTLLLLFVVVFSSCQDRTTYRAIPETAEFRAETDSAIAQFRRGERGMTYFITRNDSIIFNP